MKKLVHDECLKLIGVRIDSLNQQLHELVEGAKNDSKSTAGDKHETARAMMQMEQEKLGAQLKILETQQQVLQRLDPDVKSEVIVSGSLVQTNKGWLYLSIPLGKIRVENEDVMCLSPQSPLGVKLIGKTVGDSVDMNGITYTIMRVE